MFVESILKVITSYALIVKSYSDC